MLWISWKGSKEKHQEECEAVEKTAEESLWRLLSLKAFKNKVYFRNDMKIVDSAYGQEEHLAHESPYC